MRWIYDRGGFQPAVADGNVYFTSDEAVFALDAESGTVKWRRKQESIPVPTVPTIGGPVLVVDGWSGLTAYDATSGRRRWRFVAPGEDPLVRSSSVVADGRVFVVVRTDPDSEQSPPETSYHRLYGISLTGGDPVVTAELAVTFVSKRIVATDDRVYVTTGDARLMVFDATSGRREWSRSVSPEGVDAYSNRPAVGDDTLFLSVAGSLVAVATSDGTVRWRQPGTFKGNPAVGGTRLYCVAEDGQPRQNRLVALDPSSGRKLWRAPLQADRLYALTATGEDVFVSAKFDNTAGVIALDAEAGCTSGIYTIAAEHTTPVTLSDRTVYFGGDGMRAITRP